MIRYYKLYLLMFCGVTSTLEGPPYLTQGCSKTCSAERRFLGSFTRSFEMRSFASKEISLHSVSGKSKCPSWMEWKSNSWHALQGSPWFQPHWEPQLPLKNIKIIILKIFSYQNSISTAEVIFNFEFIKEHQG